MDIVDQCSRLLAIANITTYERDIINRVCNLVAALLVNISNDDFGALFGKANGDPPANPSGSTRNDGDTIFQTVHQGLLG